MSIESIEEMFEQHLRNKPVKFYLFEKMRMKTDKYIEWEIKKENLELVKSIPKEKRNEILKYLKTGATIGDTAKHFKIRDHMAVSYLLLFNIQHVSILRSESL